MPKIFISYRRDDSAYPAQSIYRGLATHCGAESVVFDVNTIPKGVDFVQYLNQQVSECDVLLAVIGGTWLDVAAAVGSSAPGTAGRRAVAGSCRSGRRSVGHAVGHAPHDPLWLPLRINSLYFNVTAAGPSTPSSSLLAGWQSIWS
jgi:hypothetical protein